jgi:hypothetical protein
VGEKFAQLLTEGVYRIRLHESKSIQVVQDELGYALGREGGSVIEYWRKGHLPPKLTDLEKLAIELVQRAHLERPWLEQFLRSADHPNPAGLCDELFASGPKTAKVDPPAAVRSTDPLPPLAPTPGAPNLSEPTANPFTIGPPITEPRYFFGRSYELKRIFDLLKRFPLQNVAIIGLKRSGKTSLLHYLGQITTVATSQVRPSQRMDWLPQPEQYRWIFVDFQDARMCYRERLLRYLLTSLSLPVPEPCDLAGFLDVISQELRTPTVILLDEISAALDSSELDQQFWGSLRSLGSNLTSGKLAFILTSHELPAQLAFERGKPSPFFNIFGHTFKLGPFTEAEAHEFIASSPRPFDRTDTEWIMMQSGRWPCLLQVLCHARLTALEEHDLSDGWKREGLRQTAPYWYLLGST